MYCKVIYVFAGTGGDWEMSSILHEGWTWTEDVAFMFSGMASLVSLMVIAIEAQTVSFIVASIFSIAALITYSWLWTFPSRVASDGRFIPGEEQDNPDAGFYRRIFNAVTALTVCAATFAATWSTIHLALGT